MSDTAAPSSSVVEVDRNVLATVADMHERVAVARAAYNTAKVIMKDKKQALENAQESFETACKRLMAGPPPELPLFTNQSDAIAAANADPVVTKIVERLLSHGHDTNALLVAGYTADERQQLLAWLDAMDRYEAECEDLANEPEAIVPEAPEPPAFLTPDPLTAIEVADLTNRLIEAGYRFDPQTVIAEWTPVLVAEVRSWLSAVEAVKDQKREALTFEDLPPAPAWLNGIPQEPEPEREASDDVDADDLGEADEDTEAAPAEA